MLELKTKIIKSNRFLVKFKIPHFWEKVVVVLTGDCNSRCPVCFLWGKTGINHKNLLTSYLVYEDLISFFSILPLIKPAIILTGGEPLLHPDFKKIVKFFHTKKFNITLLSNGELIEGKEKFLAKYINNVQISLDSVQQNLFATLRPNLNIQKIIFSIKTLATLKEINLALTISENNYLHLTEVINFLEREKISVKNLILLHPLFADKSLQKQQKIFLKKFSLAPSFFWEGFLKKENIKLKFLKNQIRQIKNYKLESIKKIQFMPDLSLGEFTTYYSGKEIPPVFNQKCLAPFLSLYIFPNGNIYVCPDFCLGNIKNHNLSSILQSKKLKNLQKIANKYSPYFLCRTCAALYEFS